MAESWRWWIERSVAVLYGLWTAAVLLCVGVWVLMGWDAVATYGWNYPVRNSTAGTFATTFTVFLLIALAAPYVFWRGGKAFVSWVWGGLKPAISPN